MGGGLPARTERVRSGGKTSLPTGRQAYSGKLNVRFEEGESEIGHVLFMWH